MTSKCELLENVSGINHLLARLIVEELFRCGVKDFLIAPGARSAPLAVAAAELEEREEDVKLQVHFDERGLGFLGLGIAQAKREPVCLICTSGTAVANFLPAIVEASESGIPLIVLTADRPFEVQGTFANQTINQRGIYSHYLRFEAAIEAPETRLFVNETLSLIDQAVTHASSLNQGPVHINVRFRQPLILSSSLKLSFNEEDEIRKWWESFKSNTCYRKTVQCVSKNDIEELLNNLETAKAGLIVVSGCIRFVNTRKLLTNISNKFDWPIIGDITSGLRTCGEVNKKILCHTDLFLSSDDFAESIKPDIILMIGGAPISPVINQFIKNRNCPALSIRETNNLRDEFGCISEQIVSNIEYILEKIKEHASLKPSSILNDLLKADTIAKDIIDNQNLDLTELSATLSLFSILPDNSRLFLGNSLPVRHADRFISATNKQIEIGFNRGVSGIDGLIASGVGFSLSGTDQELPTAILVGDISALHDLNSFTLLKETTACLVILNNDGGGIFNFLPGLSRLPQFEQTIATPHGLKFKAAAEMFGIKYYCPETLEEYEAILGNWSKIPTATCIEVCCDRNKTFSSQNELFENIKEKVSLIK